MHNENCVMCHRCFGLGCCLREQRQQGVWKSPDSVSGLCLFLSRLFFSVFVVVVKVTQTMSHHSIIPAASHGFIRTERSRTGQCPTMAILWQKKKGKLHTSCCTEHLCIIPETGKNRNGKNRFQTVQLNVWPKHLSSKWITKTASIISNKFVYNNVNEKCNKIVL